MNEAPEFYRGIKVPDNRKRYWDKPTMRAWREAVDATLNAVLFATKRGLKQAKEVAPIFYHTEFSEGAAYGREEIREIVMDELADLLVDDGRRIAPLGDL